MTTQSSPSQISKIKTALAGVEWRWIFGISFAVMGITSIALFFIISIFVAVRSAQGNTPTQAEIVHFSDAIAIWLDPAILLSLVFFSSAWLAIKVRLAPRWHGFIIGLVVCIFSTASDFAFSPSLEWIEVLTFLAVIACGWLGGIRGEVILKNRESVYRTSQSIKGANRAGVVNAIGEQMAGPSVVLIALAKKAGDVDSASAWTSSPNLRIPSSISPPLSTLEPASVLTGTQLPLEVAGIRSMLALPLAQVDEILLIGSRKNGFSRADIQNYLTISEQVALSLENLKLVEQAHQMGIMQERQRLAAEIHDGLTQGFISIVTHLETAEARLENQPAELRADLQGLLDQARQTARDNLTAARKLTWALHPDLQAGAPLSDALTKLTERWSAKNNIPVTFSFSGEARQLHPNVETVLLRATREALNNIQKHAHATQVTVTLTYMDSLVALDVQDNGQGFDPDALRSAKSDSGFGLKSMQEQAEKLGGELSIESESGKGTTIAMALPIE